MTGPAAPPLDDVRLRRYARQILLPELGGRGQRALLAATVHVSARELAVAQVALAYLAGAGVGTLVVRDAPPLVDACHVGFLLEPGDVGVPVLEALRRRIAERTPDTEVRAAGSADEPGPVLLSEPAAPAQTGPAELVEALWRGGEAATQALLALSQAARAGRAP